MALFKIHKGNSTNLANQSKVEGYCWFTTDDGKFYIDTSSSTRVPLNAEKADKLATGRSLKISGTAGTTGTSFNGSADATLIIPTTVKGFAELGTNKISSASGTALYIAPSSTLYLQSAASTSMIFQP